MLNYAYQMREFIGTNVHFVQEDAITYLSILSKNIDLKIAKEIVEQRLAFTGEEDALLFVDNSNIKSISKDAREYFGSKESNLKLKAMVVYASSTLSVFLANFVIRINLTNYTIPIKLFTNKEKAIEWLNSFKEK